MTGAAIALVTCPDEKTARKISDNLLSKKLAACVNMISGVKSRYRWEGKVEESEETLMIIKTRRELFGKLSAEARGAHPYDVPEIVLLGIEDGLPKYLSWLSDETG